MFATVTYYHAKGHKEVEHAVCRGHVQNNKSKEDQGTCSNQSPIAQTCPQSGAERRDDWALARAKKGPLLSDDAATVSFTLHLIFTLHLYLAC